MQQEHLPKDRDASESQQWGWEFQDFITQNFWYLVGILLLLAVFFYARHRWNVRNKRTHKN